jgi:hypothetical protein
LLCHFWTATPWQGYLCGRSLTRWRLKTFFFDLTKKWQAKYFVLYGYEKSAFLWIAIEKCFYKIFCYVPSVYKSGNHTFS